MVGGEMGGLVALVEMLDFGEWCDGLVLAVEQQQQQQQQQQQHHQ